MQSKEKSERIESVWSLTQTSKSCIYSALEPFTFYFLSWKIFLFASAAWRMFLSSVRWFVFVDLLVMVLWTFLRDTHLRSDDFNQAHCVYEANGEKSHKRERIKLKWGQIYWRALKNRNQWACFFQGVLIVLRFFPAQYLCFSGFFCRGRGGGETSVFEHILPDLLCHKNRKEKALTRQKKPEINTGPVPGELTLSRKL